ncbi:MAG: TfoX/Sxy family protein [Oscillospiraceae bacterium]|jgi:TfoX/Sxy family transcriptional regulator of competence genes|nr:TfoX/Sxy family protein [Oscillospiraceae bacterium]
MATTKDFTEFVCEQIRETGAVRYRKMFGEYMVYVNDKPLLLICDNTVYVKMLPQLTELLKDNDTGIPYDKAKEHYIIDFENAELLKTIIEIIEPITPFPKAKKKKDVT